MQHIRTGTKNKWSSSLTANTVSTYIDNVSTMSKSTADEYLARLNDFKNFIANKYDNQLRLDGLISRITSGKEDPYLVLNGYAAYLKNRNVSALTLKLLGDHNSLVCYSKVGTLGPDLLTFLIDKR